MIPIIGEMAADLAKGGAEGIFSGLGKLATSIRSAIVGPEVSAETKGALAQIAAQLEANVAMAQLELQKQQIEVNKIEAQQGPYRGGWRPFAGWSSAFAACAYPVLRLLLPWGIASIGFILGKDVSHFPQLPPMDTGEAMAVLGALLGFGGYRTAERFRGKA